MGNSTLYLACVLIWGSTWHVITYQFGIVPPAVSVAYRFALAAAMLLAWCAACGRSLRFTPRQHGWMALQGALLFGINYVFVYLSETHISSGLTALTFASMAFWNMLGARVFFGTPVSRRALGGASVGVAGVALVFAPELTQFSADRDSLAGLAFGLAATISASLGNLTAARNQRARLPVQQQNGCGMLYGSLLVGAFAWASGQPLVFDGSAHYVLSLAYLALFGSVLAFGGYLTLLGRIGADRAGYVAVAIPVVAVALSTLFEDFRWHTATLIGIAMVVLGNVMVLRK